MSRTSRRAEPSKRPRARAAVLLGSVGVAARDGFAFLAIYLGPILVFLLAPGFIARLVRHAKAEKITTVGDATKYIEEHKG